MECRLQGICKFCQPEKSELALGIEELFRQGKCLPPIPNAAERPEPVAKRHYTRKTPVGGGSIVDKEKATMRHCKKCAFICAGKYVLANHYRKEHPKTKVAGKERAARGHYKRPGGQLTSGMGLDAQKERLEPTGRGLRIGKDADVRHAFDILQTRSDDCTLSKVAQKDFDKLEDDTADIPSVTEWPISLRGRVIKLYNDVVNGVTEEK